MDLVVLYQVQPKSVIWKEEREVFIFKNTKIMGNFYEKLGWRNMVSKL